MPSISSLVARAFPLAERTRATVVNIAGIHVGTLVAMPLSAWIAAAWGWRLTFWAYAAIGLVWLVARSAWARRTPPPEAVAGAVSAVACMSGALACFAFGSSTVLVNSLDLSPRHAGVLVGLQGTAGNLAGMVSPFLGGAIVARTGRWDLNLYLLAALLAAGIVVWLRWSSGEPVTLAPARPSAAPWPAPRVRPAP